MNTLIIYDSFFGNTKRIAEAIKESIKNSRSENVKKIKIQDLENVNFLIIGSPTRAFRPSPEIKNFLEKIPANNLKNISVATFDTRISAKDTPSRLLKLMTKLFGYAADPIAKKLQKKGGKLIAAPEGFYVKDSKGPLKENEIQRAKDWGKRLSNLVQ